MHQQEVILHLSLIEGVGAVTLGKIITGIGADSLSGLYSMQATDISAWCDISPALAQTVVSGLADKQLLEKELGLLHTHQISYCTLIDRTYHQLLKHIYAAPPVLYWQGIPLDTEEQAIAVIGSRKATWYAQEVIDSIVPDLVCRGWTIVSGGAIGADTMAHQAALKAGGRTVAVLGSGLLHLYPSSNKRLFSKIRDAGGLIVSPFALSTQPFPSNFPARNRIIAGISRGCVVVQAAAQSGAAITAMFALEQGREVFAIPGPITDELSQGCHNLIRQGAILIRSSADILQEFGQEAVVRLQPSGLEKTESNSAQTVAEQVITACQEPRSIDDLVEITGLTLGQLQTILATLALDGKLAQNFIGHWQQL